VIKLARVTEIKVWPNNIIYGPSNPVMD